MSSLPRTIQNARSSFGCLTVSASLTASALLALGCSSASSNTTSSDDAGTEQNDAGADSGHSAADSGSSATDSGQSGNDANSGNDSSAVKGCAGLPLCDDFESATAGGSPIATLWTATGGCGGGGSYSAVVDNTQSHSGKNSVKIVGGDSCGPLITNTSAFTTLAGAVYGRFFARFTSGMPATHVAFMQLGLSASNMQQSNEVQLTGQNHVVAWNYQDKTLPVMIPNPVSIDVMPTTWTCIEFHTDATSGAIETWFDGAAVDGLTFIPGTTTVKQGVNDAWATGKPSPLAPKSLSFGWLDFGGGPSTIWIDDVALSSTRIGCAL